MLSFMQDASVVKQQVKPGSAKRVLRFAAPYAGLKDPYNFDFLTLAEDVREKELESGLLEHLRKFLLETRRRVCVRRQSVSAGSRRRELPD